MLALPAVFGALIVFPMAAIARTTSEGAGVIAVVNAFMPTTSKSRHGLWLTTIHTCFSNTAAFMFYLRAVKAGGDERLSRYTNAYPSGIIKACLKCSSSAEGFTEMLLQQVSVSISSHLDGKVSLYGPAIIFLALRTSCYEHV